jgi:uncharacterized protein (DUF1810 family)
MSTLSDPYDLQRFIAAQATHHGDALAELVGGAKRGHWMWFIFPQLRGLGSSPNAERYGIASLAEAQAYLSHPVLAARLQECTAAVLGHGDLSPAQLFGSPDDLKFHSSMTLFHVATGRAPSLFANALDRCCGGRPDQRTLSLLGMRSDAARVRL